MSKTRSKSLLDLSTAPDDVLITCREGAEYYGVHKNTIWRWAREGHIPQPLKIAGTNSPRWRVGDLRNALKQRAA